MIFRGVIPPVTTPFDEHGSILFDSLQRNIEAYLRTELSGLLLLGSNGEAVHLDDEEKQQIVRRVSGQLEGTERKLVVGLNGASLRDNLTFVEQVDDLPVDALLVSVPGYYRNRMGVQAMRRFFLEIAERSPFPILLYNVPQYSGLALPPDLIAELAGHERVVGMKDSSGNLIYVEAVLEKIADRSFEVLLGSAQIWGPSLTLGIRAGILAVACAFPNLPVQVLQRVLSGEDFKAAQGELFRVAQALTSGYGVPGLKYAMDLAGLEGRYCRAPLYPLNDEEKAAVKAAVAPLLEGAPVRL